MPQPSQGARTLKDIFPDLSDEELEEAEFNLRRYLSLVIEIVESQEKHPVDNLFDEPECKTVASKLPSSEGNEISEE